MANITLYGTPISTYVRTVRLLMAEAGMDHNVVDIGIFNGDNQTDAYLQKQPFGKIPVVEIDGTQIYETSAITRYLNGLAGDKFTPSDLLAQARMQQIISIIDSYLYPPVVGTIVIQRLVVPQDGGTPDEQAIQQAIAPVKKALEAIESLRIGNPFLLGQTISLADFHLVPIFVYLSNTKEFGAATAQTPNLCAWWEQIKNRESVKQMC
ncbi:MAG: glutathione S-transferase family protein [Cyanobacteria bacterium P01_A01_bin.135]